MTKHSIQSRPNRSAPVWGKGDPRLELPLRPSHESTPEPNPRFKLSRTQEAALCGSPLELPSTQSGALATPKPYSIPIVPDAAQFNEFYR